MDALAFIEYGLGVASGMIAGRFLFRPSNVPHVEPTLSARQSQGEDRERGPFISKESGGSRLAEAVKSWDPFFAKPKKTHELRLEVDRLLEAGEDPRGTAGNPLSTARQMLVRRRHALAVWKHYDQYPDVHHMIQVLTDAERSWGVPEADLSNAGPVEELANCAHDFIRYEGKRSFEDVVRLVEQNTPINERFGSDLLTPLHDIVVAHVLMQEAHLDGPSDRSRILPVLQLLLDHHADPRLINNRGVTPRKMLAGFTRLAESDPTTAEAIRLLEEGERAAERRELEQAAVGGATERSGTRRMM
ncbi:MAG TPA: hypothetical protein VME63_02390 [Dyella sp.]|uniref:hypothetical protein n=1 Tax=Dyella sp. TaxID=1869338 RepID=UPI002CC4C0BA|nr:hypothetical protein [Dyella sp.]HTV84223.1 hypothetical protein [Dyella sp.]